MTTLTKLVKRPQADPADVAFVSPVPEAWWPMIWDWIEEAPDCNRDDDGPATWQELAAARRDGAMTGEVTCGVLWKGEPVGYVAYAPVTSRVGITRGLCFTASAHGTGVPVIAMTRLLDLAFRMGGLEKVQAIYYAHNLRVAAFLRRLGFVEEGYLRDQFTQGGRPVSVRVMALFASTREGICHSEAR